MIRTIINFKCPTYYDLDMTCRAHGWKNLAPFSWDEATQTLSFAMIVEHDSVDVSVHQTRGTLTVVIFSKRKLGQRIVKHATAMIRRCLGLDLAIAPMFKVAEKAGPEYVRLIENGAGRLQKV